MKQTLTDIQVEYDEPIPIYCDNTSAINISKNLVMHSKTKHIPIKYHFLWEQVAEKNIRVEYVGTKEQVADIFTKPLPWEAFEYLRQRLGVISTPKMNECFLNAYLICLRCTRGSTIRGQSVRGSNPRWKDTFSIDDKGGEIYQMQRTEAWFQGEHIYQMQRTEAWFQGEQIYQMQRKKAWFQGEHE
jgi:hypothetical protein